MNPKLRLHTCFHGNVHTDRNPLTTAVEKEGRARMLARARLKLKNAESSIAFIQEQHTRTLEGLHQEIQNLQQKNARQLTLSSFAS